MSSAREQIDYKLAQLGARVLEILKGSTLLERCYLPGNRARHGWSNEGRVALESLDAARSLGLLGESEVKP